MKATGLIVLALLMSGVVARFAAATPLTLTRHTVDNGWEKARMHCDQYGRCWTERRRNALLETYLVAPPPHAAGERRENLPALSGPVAP